MGMLSALAVSIGILIAIWTYIAVGVAALPVWAGIVAWATFFAAGGKTDGLVRTIASNLSGVLWAFLALTVFTRMGNGNIVILSVLVGIIAAIMVLQSRVTYLGFIPGAFLGAATAVGVTAASTADTGPWTKTVIALVAGAVFGWLSEMLATAISRPAATRAEARPV